MLTGGAGADVFFFNTAPGSGNIDVITDFRIGEDKIGLDKSIFTTLPKGALNADAFYVGAAAHDATDRVIYNAKTGGLFYDDDGSGAHAAVQFAQLDTGLSSLSAASFQLI
jgi:serralysin